VSTFEDSYLLTRDPSKRFKYVPSDPTSPHWYDEDAFKRLVYSHIGHHRHEGGEDLRLRDFVRQFKGLSATAKAKAVCVGFPQIKMLSDFENSHSSSVCSLLEGMQYHSDAPSHTTLGSVGKEHFEERFEEYYGDLERFDYRKISGNLHTGMPYVVEFASYRTASVLSEFARSELRRCKAEVYEILCEEGERAAWWEAKLAAAPETDALPDDEYAELGELTWDQQEALFGWIRESLEISPEATECYRHDSYELKHIFERAPEGFYVTDAQFRAVMWLTGFLGRRYHTVRLKSPESRCYYVRPSIHGLFRKLVDAGVPSEWAWDVLFIRRCPVHDENAALCHTREQA
jgi:hypothetical protein